MNTIPLTVGILTFNSGKTLQRALESVAMCNDIIICDGGSTDDTLDIAKKYNVRIIQQDPQYKNEDGTLADYAGVRNQCLKSARNKWFLYIDSDEAVSTELINELQQVVTENSPCDGYRIPIRIVINGKKILHSSNYPGYQYRVLRTDNNAHFIKKVHERPEFKHPIPLYCTLKGPWYVFWDTDETDQYVKQNYKYIQIEKKRHEHINLYTYLFSFLPRNIRTIIGIVVRTLFNRLRYSAEECMPLRVEWGRLGYHALIVLYVTRDLFFRHQ